MGVTLAVGEHGLMSRDTRLKLAIIAAAAVVATILVVALGMRFSLQQNLAAAGVVGALGPVALFYHYRQTPEFVLSLTAVMFLMVFTSCYTVLMYAAGALSFPLIDETLASIDAALGVHLPTIVVWAEGHPGLKRMLDFAYPSVFPQTLVLVVVLGFSAERRFLESFVLQFMLALSIAAIVFCFAPAEGPFATYGYEPSESQARYLEHLRTLRSGERTEVVLKESEGLITFPSFHTAWAILLVFAVRHRRRLLIPSILLNAAVVAATLTTGWHYFVDVIAGVVLAMLVIALTKRLEPWLYPESAGSNS